MEHSGFPSDETLAVFIEGRLDPETREKVIAHMATCAECYSVFMSATEMNAALAAPSVSYRSSHRAWIAVGATTMAAVVAVVVLVAFPHRDRGMTSLARAAPEFRTIAGRLSGFPYQPMRSSQRATGGYDPMKDPANAKLQTAAAGVKSAANERHSATNLHALGVADLLLLTDHGDAAIAAMHEALRIETGQRDMTNAIKDSDDVSLLNDLSVALANRATTMRHPTDNGESVVCAERAWQLGRTREAAWNRAIAIELFSGPASARPAWHDYLALDPSSKWADEARKKLSE
jgi:hypothetical protein